MGILKIILALLYGISIFCIFQVIINKVLDKILADIRVLDPKGANLVTKRSNQLGYIVIVIAIIEYLFFAVLFLWFAKDNQITEIEIGSFFKFLTGWIAVKMIPSYKMWSSPIVGKAYFYRSLFGTIISIISGIFFGIIIFKIFV